MIDDFEYLRELTTLARTSNSRLDPVESPVCAFHDSCDCDIEAYEAKRQNIADAQWERLKYGE